MRNVAAQTHFHTVGDPLEPDGFERLLGEYESDSIELIRTLASGKAPLGGDDRWNLSFFIALQYLRGPDTRRTNEMVKGQLIRLQVGAGGRKHLKGWISRNLGFEPTEEQAERIWQEATQPGGPPISFPNEFHISYMVETAEKLTRYIATRPWNVVRFNRRSLFTSDSPVNLIGYPEHEPWSGVGFMTAWGITYPLNRKVGLLMGNVQGILNDLEGDEEIQAFRRLVLEGRADQLVVGTTAYEALFNEHTLRGAREYLYHHPDDGDFIPTSIPKPELVNMRLEGLVDQDFDGTPWFESNDSGAAS